MKRIAIIFIMVNILFGKVYEYDELNKAVNDNQMVLKYLLIDIENMQKEIKDLKNKVKQLNNRLKKIEPKENKKKQIDIDKVLNIK